MYELTLSIGEPFTSPAWGSNFVVFSGEGTTPIPEEETKEYLRKVCKYAKNFQVYLVPERFVLMGFHCMCLISPQGKVVGAQRAIHHNTLTKNGYKRGASLDVYSTEFGGIFLCVDVDVYRPEIARIAAQMGANYIICSQTMSRADYCTQMVLTGIWNASQSNNVYGVAVSNQFHCICAPRLITPSSDGFVAKPTLKTPLVRTISANDLLRCPRRRPLSRKLYAVHKSEFITP